MQRVSKTVNGLLNAFDYTESRNRKQQKCHMLRSNADRSQRID